MQGEPILGYGVWRSRQIGPMTSALCTEITCETIAHHGDSPAEWYVPQATYAALKDEHGGVEPIMVLDIPIMKEPDE